MAELIFALLKVSRCHNYLSLDQNVEMIKTYFESKELYHRELLSLRKMDYEGIAVWVAKISGFNTFSLKTKKSSNAKALFRRSQVLTNVRNSRRFRDEANERKSRPGKIQEIFVKHFFQEMHALFQQPMHAKILNENVNLLTEMCLQATIEPDYMNIQKEVEKYIFNVSTFLINEKAVDPNLVSNFIDLSRYLIDALVNANIVF